MRTGNIPHLAEVLQRHSRPFTIILTPLAATSIYADITVFSLKSSQTIEAKRKNLFPCTLPVQLSSFQILRRQYRPAVSCKPHDSSNPLKSHRKSMVEPLQRRQKTISNKRFYAYVDILLTKSINLPKIMIVASVSSAPACIVSVQVHHTYMLKKYLHSPFPMEQTACCSMLQCCSLEVHPNRRWPLGQAQRNNSFGQSFQDRLQYLPVP